jgi:fermentation-respiration switch protein FrsA (DUF1100 family)
MLYTILVILGVWLVYAVLATAVQRRIVFPRHFAAEARHPRVDVKGLEKHRLETSQGEVELWYLPGEGASADRPAPAVLFAHGNGELIDGLPEQLAPWRRRGLSVMLCEYRGYGRSAGTPSQKRITEDFIRAYDRLAERPEVDAERIIFHGRSLGAGVVCSLARHRRPVAMILQSPFISVARLAAWYLIPRPLVLDPFDNAAVLRNLDVPVLIQHGTEDRIIPISHGRRLQEIAPHATLLEYDCGHNDFPVESPQYWADMERFLKEHDLLLGLAP